MQITETDITGKCLPEMERLEFAKQQNDLRIANAPRPTINEWPVTFERKPLPDTGTHAALIKQLRTSIANGNSELADLNRKRERLEETIGRHSGLKQKREDLISLIQDVKANALLDESQTGTMQTAELERTLAEVEAELADVATELDATHRAKEMVTARKSKLTEHLATIGSQLEAAEGKWMAAYHAAVMQDFREGLHDLYRKMAIVLAAECSGRLPDYTGWTVWRFIRDFSYDPTGEGGIQYRDPSRPQWANSSVPKSFPGFAEASAALRLTLAAVGSDV